MTDAAVVLADRETGELVQDPIAYMAVVLNRAKSWLDEAQSIDDVRATKAMAMGYEVVIREKELAFDAQLSATEIVRRCERRIDHLTPRHQGTSVPAGTEVNDPRGAGKTLQEHRVMGAPSDDDFDAAVNEARAEGNLSRANVVRKIRGDETPDDADPYDRDGELAMQRAMHLQRALSDVDRVARMLCDTWDDLREPELREPAEWARFAEHAAQAIALLLTRIVQTEGLRRVK